MSKKALVAALVVLITLSVTATAMLPPPAADK